MTTPVPSVGMRSAIKTARRAKKVAAIPFSVSPALIVIGESAMKT